MKIFLTLRAIIATHALSATRTRFIEIIIALALIPETSLSHVINQLFKADAT